jgi:L-fuculose-phosphate aldolase
MLLEEQRDQLTSMVRHFVPDGLVVGTAGNMSARSGDLVAITPSSVPYDKMTPESMCVLDIDGHVVEADLRPSTEVPMHLAVYRSTKAGGVVHTHSPYATALSTVIEELPAIHYIIAALGETVRVAPYETFGSDALAESMINALSGRKGVILQNHGTITYGHDLLNAYDRSLNLEWLCATFWRASVFGQPKTLTPEQIEDVRQQARSKARGGS